MPTNVRFIPPAAPARGGGYELVPPGGGVEERTPAGGGVETGAMPTSVLFIPAFPAGGGCELVPAGRPRIAPEEAPGGGVDGLVVPVGGGVAPGDMPTSVFFIAAAAGGAAFIAPDDGVGRGGLIVAPQTPHVAVSGLAGDPQRGQTLMRADYFPQIQNAMA